MKNFKWILSNVLLASLGLGSCHQPAKHAPTRNVAHVLDSSMGSCPYLTRTTTGNIVLSWIRQDAGNATVWFTYFDKSTQAFQPPREIPTSQGVEPHGENMPKMVFQGEGRILAMYGVKNPQPDNPYTGAVYYTWSVDSGRHWTKGQPLFSSSGSFDQRYFDIALLPSGQVGAVWLNNSEPTGSTLYFATTGTDGKFGTAKVIARHTCQCCRTDLFCDSAGTIHVAWRAIIGDSIRDMEYCYSSDTGKTFTVPVRISADNWVVSGCPHTGPSMAENEGALHFVWFTMGGGGGVYYCHTRDTGRNFSMREPVSQITSARHPQIAALPGGDLAIVWDEGAGTATIPHQRIGLQLRGPGGLLLSTRYVSSDSISAYFPQIAVMDNSRALIAYTESDGPGERICYRIVGMKP